VPSVLAYHRPGNLDEASTLLAGDNRRALGGGTVVVPDSRVQRDVGVELVDLQALGLDGIESDGDRVVMGAMVRLGELTTHELAPALLRDLARRELPSALRNQATIGGTVALAESSSVLLAGLLVHDAQVMLHGSTGRQLDDVLASGLDGGIITAVSIDSTGHGAIAATGRTPADEPIVAAVARTGADGVRLVLTGVAPTPIQVDPADPTAGLSPIGDFRGSVDYRLHLAAVLSARVVEEVAS